MKKLLILALAFVACVSVEAKKVKVSVIPSTAKIYVDGSLYGEGVAMVKIKKNEGFISLKVEEPGYVTIETKVYANDTRKAISFKLREDPLWESTTESGNANKNFTVRVSKDLYKVGENGKQDRELVWKLIHSIILNYFDEIQTSDMSSGYVQTAWAYRKFPEADKTIRTRISVKETGFGSDLSFQIKISSEIAPLRGTRNVDAYKATDRILKDIEPIINEFQSRLGKM
jgi:hypothetical protein